MESQKQKNFLVFRTIGWLTPSVQVVVIGLLYGFTAFLFYRQYELHGTLFPYPVLVSILLAPLYEEIIFRGWLLPFFVKRTNAVKAVIITSALSALWYLTNFTWITTTSLLQQFVLMGIVIAPLLCGITLRTRSVWPAVIIRYALSLLLGLSLWTILALIIIV